MNPFLTIDPTLNTSPLGLLQDKYGRDILLVLMVYVPDTSPCVIWFQTSPDTGYCTVHQLADRDYTEPMVEIALQASDDKSEVTMTMDVGTVAGVKDVMEGKELGGPLVQIEEVGIRH